MRKFLELLSALWVAFDVRIVFFFGGLGLLGYGLYLYQPRISYCVVGALLMVLGYVLRGKS